MSKLFKSKFAFLRATAEKTKYKAQHKYTYFFLHHNHLIIYMKKSTANLQNVYKNTIGKFFK